MSIPFEQHPLYATALVFVLALGAITLPVLFFVTAPYGRHQRAGWGPVIPAKLAWVIMEAPSPIAFGVVYALSPNAARPMSLLALGLYMTHYLYRSFVFPFRMRGSNKTKPGVTGRASQLSPSSGDHAVPPTPVATMVTRCPSPWSAPSPSSSSRSPASPPPCVA